MEVLGQCKNSTSESIVFTLTRIIMAHKTGSEDVRVMRRLIDTKEQHAVTLVAAKQWQPAKAELDIAIPACREVNLRPILLRMLALSAQVENALGGDDKAKQILAGAKLLHEDLSESISNPDHRFAFLKGSVAKQLQLV